MAGTGPAMTACRWRPQKSSSRPQAQPQSRDRTPDNPHAIPDTAAGRSGMTADGNVDGAPPSRVYWMAVHKTVMPGLDPGIHAFARGVTVDGRDKPGHDGGWKCWK